MSTNGAKTTRRCATYLKVAPAKHALVKYQSLGYKIRFGEFYVRITAGCYELLIAQRYIVRRDVERFQHVAQQVRLTL